MDGMIAHHAQALLMASWAESHGASPTILTLTSVILLPGALLAAVMGMNFQVGLFSDAWLFWVTVAVIIAIAPLTFGIAKRRRWI